MTNVACQKLTNVAPRKLTNVAPTPPALFGLFDFSTFQSPEPLFALFALFDFVRAEVGNVETSGESERAKAQAGAGQNPQR